MRHPWIHTARTDINSISKTPYKGLCPKITCRFNFQRTNLKSFKSIISKVSKASSQTKCFNLALQLARLKFFGKDSLVIWSLTCDSTKIRLCFWPRDNGWTKCAPLLRAEVSQKRSVDTPAALTTKLFLRTHVSLPKVSASENENEVTIASVADFDLRCYVYSFQHVMVQHCLESSWSDWGRADLLPESALSQLWRCHKHVLDQVMLSKMAKNGDMLDKSWWWYYVLILLLYILSYLWTDFFSCWILVSLVLFLSGADLGTSGVWRMMRQWFIECTTTVRIAQPICFQKK